MITNGKPTMKETHVVANFSELARDVVELAELQGKLAALDSATAWQRMRGGLVLVVIGACALLGCLPVVLAMGAAALVEFAGWTWTASFALAGGGGFVIAGVVLAVAYQRLRTMLEPFDRSREELASNLAWLKSRLEQPQAAARRDRMKDVSMPS